MYEMFCGSLEEVRKNFFAKVNTSKSENINQGSYQKYQYNNWHRNSDQYNNKQRGPNPYPNHHNNWERNKNPNNDRRGRKSQAKKTSDPKESSSSNWQEEKKNLEARLNDQTTEIEEMRNLLNSDRTDTG